MYSVPLVLVIILEVYQTTGKLALLDSNLSTLELEPQDLGPIQ